MSNIPTHRVYEDTSPANLIEWKLEQYNDTGIIVYCSKRGSDTWCVALDTTGSAGEIEFMEKSLQQAGFATRVKE